MRSSNKFRLNVAPEVLRFVQLCREPVDLRDPVLSLILGRFEDEKEANYRISFAERSELNEAFFRSHTSITTDQLGELFVPTGLLHSINGKEMHLVHGDCIEFKSATGT